MKSPLIIIIELLAGLIASVVSTIGFTIEKLGELFSSLLFISKYGVLGILIAIVIGVAVFLFCAKFIFKNWKSLFALLIALATVLFIFVFLGTI